MINHFFPREYERLRPSRNLSASVIYFERKKLIFAGRFHFTSCIPFYEKVLGKAVALRN